MTVTVEFRDRVAVIRIDDGKRNVINHALLDALEASWREAVGKADAVVLVGRDGSFCAGYDIRVMTGGDTDAARELGRRGGRFAYELYGSSIPTVAVSTGHAFTIGAVWLACCDERIGVPGDYQYSMTEVALNVPLSGWPLEPLKERLNPAHRVPALLHARRYDPAGAVAAGFIDELADPAGGAASAIERAIERAVERAAALGELPREAYSISKRQLRARALARMATDLGID